MTEEANIFFQLGLATFLGTLLGHWAKDVERKPMSVGVTIFLCILLLASASLPEWDVLIAASVVFILMSAFIPFIHRVNAIDQRRIAKRRMNAASIVHAYRTQNADPDE